MDQFEQLLFRHNMYCFQISTVAVVHPDVLYCNPVPYSYGFVQAILAKIKNI